MNNFFRSEDVQKQYETWRTEVKAKNVCPICERPAIQAFTYWKIIDNHFPYDLIAKTHHMIVPLRHIREQSLTAEEMAEYWKIKAGPLQEYDLIAEATYKRKSIPEHFHMHLLVTKPMQ